MSSSATTSRSTQYTVLNASLEKLKRNLEVLDSNIQVTKVQAEWATQLSVIHSSIFMASAKVLNEDFAPEKEQTPGNEDSNGHIVSSGST
ncbi:hypothetical protein BG004_005225 [Podila humilis]|nr:hypothetical protein BG004_005225 [Podila humilis]